MAKDIKTMAQGTVSAPLPPMKLDDKEFKLKIISVHPENGYESDDDGQDDLKKPRPSDNQMVRVAYPAGIEKTHQCKNVKALVQQIEAFMAQRFDIKDLIIQTPKKMADGETITVEVNHDD